MTPQELFDRFRADVEDIASPYLWSDDEVWAYMNWAQKEFVRLMGGISDASSDATRIGVATGEEFALIDERILKIRRAARVSDYFKLEIVSFEDMDRLGSEDDYGRITRYALTDRTGPVRALVVGMEEGKVRWIDIPEADDEVQLVVQRLPLCDVSSEDGSKLELREEYHEDLLLGMKHKAHLKQDAETFDKKRSDESLALFRAAAETARREQGMRRFKPHRAVTYGGL